MNLSLWRDAKMANNPPSARLLAKFPELSVDQDGTKAPGKFHAWICLD
jgi:hypothetical protein